MASESFEKAKILDGVRLALGELELEETDRGGYLRLRAAITFTVPDDLAPGVYGFDYCNADCSERLGDLIGGIVYVGVDPEFPVSREWPLDDPEVANLDESATLAGPGFEVNAVEVQTGPQAGFDVGEGELVESSDGIPWSVLVAAALVVVGIGGLYSRRHRLLVVDRPGR